MKALETKLQLEGIPVWNLTSSTDEAQVEFDENMLFHSADGTTLKTIIRSNPGVLLLKGCEVVQKWPSSRYPDFETIDVVMKKS